MSHSEASRRLSSAGCELERAIGALIALDPGPDYLEPLETAAALLAGISLDNLSPAERITFAEKLKLFAARTGQAQTLLESAGALHFGALLENNRHVGGYGLDGAPESALSTFHIDG